jgi:hypothetical protein
LLPRAAGPALLTHLQRVRQVHQADRRAGYGAVALPDALARRYPNAATE